MGSCQKDKGIILKGVQVVKVVKFEKIWVWKNILMDCSTLTKIYVGFYWYKYINECRIYVNKQMSMYIYINEHVYTIKSLP